jgi:hypothetical protein
MVPVSLAEKALINSKNKPLAILNNKGFIWW